MRKPIVDLITNFALSIDNPLLKDIGMFLNAHINYAILVLILLFFGEDRNAKRAKILLSMLIVLAIGTMVKPLLATERPCSGEPWCPTDYSFPSLHAAIAFSLMIGFLNKRIYPVYLLFALFVAFTRLNLGVHTFYDVAGALAVAVFSYYITDVLWQQAEKVWPMRTEAHHG